MIRSAWFKIKEPRELRLFYFMIYALAAVAGASAIQHPPQSIEGVIGTTLAYVWAGFLLIGGVVGFISVNPGAWWLERIACVCAFVGAGIYGTVVLSLHVTSDQGNRIPQVCIIGITFVLFGFRAWRIKDHDYEPRG